MNCFFRVMAAIGLFAAWSSFSAPAQETESEASRNVSGTENEADRFLEKVYKKYDMPLTLGLKAVSASLWIRESEDPELAGLKDSVRIDYVWEFPFIDDVSLKHDSEAVQEHLKTMLKGIWRDWVAGAVFG
ncbi:MAG: hypothetical protein ABIK28_22280, partial [Planctomycetota bacterium]